MDVLPLMAYPTGEIGVDRVLGWNLGVSIRLAEPLKPLQSILPDHGAWRAVHEHQPTDFSALDQVGMNPG